ncbi:MAG TPA: glycosyltransferase [Candidatus Omnitrophota bacterium]|nr:glycosyltransferase [Candidatus Omnitrophota bacterium]
MADVSVILPTRDGEAYLDDCLRMVFGQNGGRSIEVIAIDSGSTDRTLDILAKYPVKLLRIRPDQFRHSATRNLGAKNASGKYLVFVNQDAVPADREWLNGLISAIESDPEIAGAFSRQLPREDCPLFVKCELESFYTDKSRVVTAAEYRRASAARKRKLIVFSTVSAALRRDVWEKIPFDERLYFAEDQGWSSAALARGYSIVYAAGSMVFHSHDYSMRQWFRMKYDSFIAMNRILGQRLLNSLLIFPGMILGIGSGTIYIVRQKLPLARKISEWNMLLAAQIVAAAARISVFFRPPKVV